VAFQRKKAAAIGVKAPFLGFVEPALATSIERVPVGARWIHEIKFDGYRVQVHLVNEAVKVFTRRGNDWTKRFRKVADDAWHISAGRRSLTARSLCRPPTARQTFQCCRTN
jgi:bifunctional non-homologous end joining protein LigD